MSSQLSVVSTWTLTLSYHSRSLGKALLHNLTSQKGMSKIGHPSLLLTIVSLFYHLDESLREEMKLWMFTIVLWEAELLVLEDLLQLQNQLREAKASRNRKRRLKRSQQSPSRSLRLVLPLLITEEILLLVDARRQQLWRRSFKCSSEVLTLPTLWTREEKKRNVREEILIRLWPHLIKADW